MLKIILRNKSKEIALAQLLHGESITTGTMYLNYPVAGMTRKDRRTGLYKVVNSPANV